MIDTLVNALVKIGNHQATLKICEPDVMQPMNLEAWMVKRTLVSLELFNQVAKEESELRKANARGTRPVPKKE